MARDPAVLFVKPGAIKAVDKRTLQKAGIIVVEVDDVANVKLVRATAELSSTEMLALAAAAIRKANTDGVRIDFARLICIALESKGSPA